jgi:hypothetical protein
MDHRQESNNPQPKKEVIMKKILCSLAAILAGVAMHSQTIVPAGNISGTWTAEGSPYLVMGETAIPDDSTLTIEPGVRVEWQGSYCLSVQGRILALGTETDSIRFTAADTDTGWRSIQFKQTPLANDTSRFVFCAFSYGKAHGVFPDNCGGAICVLEFSKLVIDHCLFDRNEARDTVINPGPTNPNSAGGAIALDSASPVIKNSRFTNNIAVAGGAIICGMGGNALVSNNEFYGNTAVSYGQWGQGYGGALCIYDGADPDVSGNLFRDNVAEVGGGAISIVINCSPEIDHNLIDHNTADAWGGGIEIWDNCSPHIFNNTIVSNNGNGYGNGIDIDYYSMPQIRNNILWDNNSGTNTNQVYISATSVPDFYYDDIQGGESAITGNQYIGDYIGCIDLDPNFLAPENHCYHLLKDVSPCIDAGDPDPVYNDPDGSRNDMGALWPPLDYPCGIPGHGSPGKTDVVVCPNPATDEVTISWNIPVCLPACASSSRPVIRISDMSGKEVKILSVQPLPGGSSVRVNLTGIPAGMYLVTLKADDRQGMEKLVVK